MDIKKIVSMYLQIKSYDGLYNEMQGCSCFLCDLMPCDGRDIRFCVPGKKKKYQVDYKMYDRISPGYGVF